MLALYFLLCGSLVAAANPEGGYWVATQDSAFFQVAQALGFQDYGAIKEPDRVTSALNAQPERVYTATLRVFASSAVLELNADPSSSSEATPSTPSPSLNFH